MNKMSLLSVTGAVGLLPFLQEPFAFFGYSMGALLAYEMGRWLKKSGRAGPKLFIAAASPAPHMPRNLATTFDLPDQKLIAKLRDLEGTPPEVLEQPELMELLLPAIRADFEVTETYQWQDEGIRFSCPILAIGGSEDETVSVEELDGWSIHTSGEFSRQILRGNHFFILDSPRSVIDTIVPALEKSSEVTGSTIEGSEAAFLTPFEERTT